ncbi:MAG: hypothetical protein DI603_17355 [Roseateles depolymerans]|uniref:Uncharacterized protein n=1 Tax=Roseateles depolymerans TaxID=76731 RepID=A0A2W5DLW8_9BURK|nr:MAG: hypothetical protein DI603_17355 [Roseateles depolymerans]
MAIALKSCPHCHGRHLSLMAVLRSDPRRPLRCAACGEFSCLPRRARVLCALWPEVAALAALAGLGVFDAALLFPAALAVALALCALTVGAWPLQALPAADSKVSFRRPSVLVAGRP